MGSVTVRQHDGKKIIYGDYQGTTPDKVIGLLDEIAAEVSRGPRGARILNNLTGVGLSPAFMKRAKEHNELVFGPNGTKLALVGIDGLKGILLRGFNAVSSGTKGVPFPDEQSALRYLCED